MSLKKLVELPFVVVVILSKVAKAKRFSFFEKCNLFFVMNSLWIKAAISNNKDNLIEQKVLRFNISAYGYHTLFYLLDEIFLQAVYQFESDTEMPAIVDCGANIGISMLYFKYLYPGSTVYCFEPNPSVYRLLEANVKRNGLTGVVLYNVALSDKEGFLDFYVGDEKGSFVSSTDNSRGGTHIEVPSRCMSAVFADQQFDLIKIDVEGSEWQIVEDLAKSKRLRMTKQYVIEYHHHLPGSDGKLGKFLDYFEKENCAYTLKADYEKPGDFQCVMVYVAMG
jgi:FkbM family methyltransferase